MSTTLTGKLCSVMGLDAGVTALVAAGSIFTLIAGDTGTVLPRVSLSNRRSGTIEVFGGGNWIEKSQIGLIAYAETGEASEAIVSACQRAVRSLSKVTIDAKNTILAVYLDDGSLETTSERSPAGQTIGKSSISFEVHVEVAP